MNNSHIDRAVEELELHVAKEQAFAQPHQTTEQEIADIYKIVKVPTVFERVEYSPCVIVEDNR